ncbi:MAG: hypothetical protein V1900_02775, partial [Candidatus Aenigmatarchaeota archaeon]
ANTAKYFEDIGVERITLPPNFNRMLAALEKLRRNVDCELETIVNLGCLWECPINYYHASLGGHFSQDDMRMDYVDYPRLKCSMKRLEPTELIKSGWIRPEDVHIFEKAGIEWFKIAGREKSTEWLLRCAKAYSTGCYDGNLIDLLENTFIETDKPPFYIDNKKLDGFINFFIDGNCKNECKRCDYCPNAAEKSVYAGMQKEEIDAYRNKLEHLLSKSLSR